MVHIDIRLTSVRSKLSIQAHGSVNVKLGCSGQLASFVVPSYVSNSQKTSGQQLATVLFRDGFLFYALSLADT